MKKLMKNPAPKKTAGRRRPSAARKKAKPLNGRPSDWIEKYAQDPQEVRSFCAHHELFDAAASTVRLAQETYKPQRLRAQVEGDPEGSSEWLVFDVMIKGAVDDAHEANDRFTKRWLEMFSVRELMLLRVLYHIV